MAQRDYLTGRFKASAAHTMRVSMAGLLQQALAELASRASQGLKASVEALATPPSRADQRAMYERLGEATRQAVLDQYDREIENNGHARYRASGVSQRLTGRLRPLLDGNVDGTIYRIVGGPNRNGGVRIELFNPAALNARARHWARLEFGAGTEAAGDRPRRFTFGLRGAQVALQLGGGPRPGFMIPKGYWVENGEVVAPGAPVQGSKFYLAGGVPAGLSRRGVPAQRPMVTVGFAGRHYLEAGLAEFADRAPTEFNRMIVDTLGSRSRLRFTYTVTTRAA
jgi:hypothetical protein